MQAQQIRCSISNCHYWLQGNQCGADQILVTSRAMANSLPDAMDAPDAPQVVETPVHTYDSSCCKTFVSKQAYAAFEDGVTKGEGSL